MNFPPIPKYFSCMDGASFDFDDFIFGTSDVVVVQSGAGTFATAGTTKTARTSGGAPSGS